MSRAGAVLLILIAARAGAIGWGTDDDTYGAEGTVRRRIDVGLREFYRLRSRGETRPSPSNLRNAFEAARNTNTPVGGNTILGPDAKWVPLGRSAGRARYDPYGGGPIQALAIDPHDPQVMYLGATFGGIWKSEDGGQRWTAVSDQASSSTVSALSVDPVRPTIVYAGTGERTGPCDAYFAAGLLRSTDAGRTWVTLATPFAGQSVSRIAIDPLSAGTTETTTVYATTARTYATWDADCSLGSAASLGGLWRSTNSGATWARLEVAPAMAASGARFTDILLDSDAGDGVYVAVDAWDPTWSGVWKTVNMRTAVPEFQRLATGLPSGDSVPTAGPIILAHAGAGGTRVVYALVITRDMHRTFGLFTTSDGGASWRHVDAGHQGTLKLIGDGWADAGGRRFDDVSPGQTLLISGRGPMRAVAIGSISGDGTRLQFKGAEGIEGATYSLASYPPLCDGDCYASAVIATDPRDDTATTLVVGGTPSIFGRSVSPHSLWRSTDGGNTWAAISDGTPGAATVSDGYGAIVFDRMGSVFAATDRGLWSISEEGLSAVSRNVGLALGLPTGVALHATDRRIVAQTDLVSGTQITGQPGVCGWTTVDAAGISDAVFARSDPQRLYWLPLRQGLLGPSYGRVRTDAAARDACRFVGGVVGEDTALRNGFLETTEPDELPRLMTSNALGVDALYVGTTRIYRSETLQPPCCEEWTVRDPDACNSGCRDTGAWKVVSGNLTGRGAHVSAMGSFDGVVPGISGPAEVVYTGTSDGKLWVSADISARASTNAIWFRIDFPVIGNSRTGLPQRAVTAISVDDRDPNIAVATVSGYAEPADARRGHVFMTTNGLRAEYGGDAGFFWDVSGDLPNVPVNAVVKTPDGLFVATDVGVFVAVVKDVNPHWVWIKEGLPRVPVVGLSYNAVTRHLVASTLGRGLFELKSSETCWREDVNGDGVVDAHDVFWLIQRVSFGGLPVGCSTGDLNNDGVVDLDDALTLVEYVFGSSAVRGEAR